MSNPTVPQEILDAFLDLTAADWECSDSNEKRWRTCDGIEPNTIIVFHEPGIVHLSRQIPGTLHGGDYDPTENYELIGVVGEGADVAAAKANAHSLASRLLASLC